ncbi:MAG TPA: type II toxin-antitoxin system VapC family toxin [Acidimicrobiia bacterium]
MPDPKPLVIDASAVVDLLLAGRRSARIADRVRHAELHAPANLDAEVLSALARLQRAGVLTAARVPGRLRRLAGAPIERHALADLLEGAWQRRHSLRVVDALYVELAEQIGTIVVTTDRGMGTTDHAELIVD